MTCFRRPIFYAVPLIRQYIFPKHSPTWLINNYTLYMLSIFRKHEPTRTYTWLLPYAGLILTFLAIIYFYLAYRTKKLMKYYEKLFTQKGYRVFVQPYQFFSSAACDRLKRDGIEHGNEYYSFETKMTNYDVAISSLDNKPYLQIFNLDCFKDYFGHLERFYHKYQPGMGNMYYILGGMFCSEGETWRRKRDAIEHIFTPRFTEKNLLPIVINSANKILNVPLETYIPPREDETLLKILGEKPGKTHRVWLLDLFSLYLSSVGVGLMFGDLPEEKRLIAPEVTIEEHMVRLVRLIIKYKQDSSSSLLGPGFLKLGLRPQDSELDKLLDMYKYFATKLIKERIETLEGEQGRLRLLESSARGGLLEELYYSKRQQAFKEKEERSNEFLEVVIKEADYGFEQLIEESLTFFVGLETASNVLTMAIVYLSNHPDVLDKLTNEIQSIIKSNGDLTNQNLKSMVYLDCVVKEVFRMYGPSAALYLRKVVKEHALGGVPMVPETLVSFVFVPNRFNPKYFSEPKVFKPERWLQLAQQKLITPEDLDLLLMPFSSGRRKCIGADLVMMNIKIMLIQMVQKYEFLILEDVNLEFRGTHRQPIKFATYLTLKHEIQKPKRAILIENRDDGKGVVIQVIENRFVEGRNSTGEEEEMQEYSRERTHTTSQEIIRDPDQPREPVQKKLESEVVLI